jgi:hypothetical protein
MARKRYKPEEIVAKLRQVDVVGDCRSMITTVPKNEPIRRGISMCMTGCFPQGLVAVALLVELNPFPTLRMEAW